VDRRALRDRPDEVLDLLVSKSLATWHSVQLYSLPIQFSGILQGGTRCSAGGAVTAPAGTFALPGAPPSPSSAMSAEYSESNWFCLLVCMLGSPRPRQSRAICPAAMSGTDPTHV
jgi:hypothetical protein